jgi:hypothetical protein
MSRGGEAGRDEGAEPSIRALVVFAICLVVVIALIIGGSAALA